MQAPIAKSQKLERRVLVVDDDLDTARTLFLLLLDMGHYASFAINGYAAMAEARRIQPEVVLLDLGLPDFDGCALVKHLRRIPGCESARIIAITGQGEHHRLRSLAAGCEAFYVKPLDPMKLTSLLAR